MNAMDIEVQRRQAGYDDVRAQAKEAEIEDLPLTPDWAASDFDAAPSQANSAVYEMGPADQRRRAMRVRRWDRQTTRARPFGVGNKVTPAPAISPEHYRRLSSPRMYESTGNMSPELSRSAYTRRIRRMSAVAAHLRRQFESKLGLQYNKDRMLQG